MAATHPPAGGKQAYDYLIKLLLIGDSGKFLCLSTEAASSSRLS
jgi:hypothetical protein